MSLTLYLHPLSSFCWKVLVGLYENETPFEPRIIDLGDAASRAELVALWPLAKFPVLRDEARDQTIPESSIILEYLSLHHPGRTALIPADADLAREVRLQDRFQDLHVHLLMQKIVGDKLRPEGSRDPHGVESARAQLTLAYAMIDRRMETRTWSVGETYTMADCSASPAMYYANRVHPIPASNGHAIAYLKRLMERPSFARVMKEAEPYMKFFPG